MANKITNHGTLADSINWSDFFESQAMNPAALDNKFKANESKAKSNSNVKKLSKTKKPSQRHR